MCTDDEDEEKDLQYFPGIISELCCQDGYALAHLESLVLYGSFSALLFVHA